MHARWVESTAQIQTKTHSHRWSGEAYTASTTTMRSEATKNWCGARCLPYDKMSSIVVECMKGNKIYMTAKANETNRMKKTSKNAEQNKVKAEKENNEINAGKMRNESSSGCSECAEWIFSIARMPTIAVVVDDATAAAAFCHLMRWHDGRCFLGSLSIHLLHIIWNTDIKFYINRLHCFLTLAVRLCANVGVCVCGDGDNKSVAAHTIFCSLVFMWIFVGRITTDYMREYIIRNAIFSRVLPWQIR